MPHRSKILRPLGPVEQRPIHKSYSKKRSTIPLSLNDVNNLPRRKRHSIVSPRRPTSPRVIENCLSAIYRDLENIYQGKAIVGQEPGLVIRYARSFLRKESNELHARRWAKFAVENGWMLLGICANSPSFQDAVVKKGEDYWPGLCKMITENRYSLELFAKVRGVDWEKPLMTGLERNVCKKMEGIPLGSKMTIEPDNPYHYALSSDTAIRNKYAGAVQMDIDESVFNPSDFPGRHPLERQDGICLECESYTGCRCDGTDFFDPLVEIIDHGPPMGRGIRTLEDIPEDRWLGVYHGRVYSPSRVPSDSTYFFNHDNDEVRESKRRAHRRYIGNAIIDAAREGSWSRYMNHSCNNNVIAHQQNLGLYSVIAVRATKDIPAFSELYLNYGRSYFRDRFCYCGEPDCMMPAESKV